MRTHESALKGIVIDADGIQAWIAGVPVKVKPSCEGARLVMQQPDIENWLPTAEATERLGKRGYVVCDRLPEPVFTHTELDGCFQNVSKLARSRRIKRLYKIVRPLP